MTKQSVLPPAQMGEKPPFNKKLVWVAVILAALAVGVSGYMSKKAKTLTTSEEEAAFETQTPFVQGTSRSIDAEWNTIQEDNKKRQSQVFTDAMPQDNKIVGTTEIRSINGSKENRISEHNGIKTPDEEFIAGSAVAPLLVFDESTEDQADKVQDSTQSNFSSFVNNFENKRLSETEALQKAIAQSGTLSGNSNIAGETISQKTEKFMKGLKDSPNRILRPEAAPGEWIVTSGKVIPAVTTRAQNSDLPCAIQARVTTDVYDSITSTKVLIPKGSELVGICSNDIAYGQDRILSAFTRLILPNGQSINLANGIGMDRIGASGLKGEVNNHFFKMFASSFLIAFAADRVENKNRNINNGYYSSQAGAQTAAGEVLVDVSQNVLERNKKVQPTIYVEEGVRINVQVAHDMVFD